MPKADLPAMVEFLQKRKDWENPEFEPYKPIGFDGSLTTLDLEDGQSEEICWGWNPRRIENSMESHTLLSQMHKMLNRKVKNPGGMWLEGVACAMSSRGWAVGANFSPAVWNIIESQAFQEWLPTINENIQKWWEDQTWSRQRAQYTTVFDGRDGPTLQVYQPAGNGLWICGCRNDSYSQQYQITDHNTDTPLLALGHVVSLCTILKFCRQIAPSSSIDKLTI
ncbi:MAG: hypothetical protein WDZ73_01060 [Candidatus Paceibacterota bacterium]